MYKLVQLLAISIMALVIFVACSNNANGTDAANAGTADSSGTGKTQGTGTPHKLDSTSNQRGDSTPHQ